jgi:phosphohistidine swiveling domain-containing protein
MGGGGIMAVESLPGVAQGDGGVEDSVAGTERLAQTAQTLLQPHHGKVLQP